jgi:hypothetical protein
MHNAKREYDRVETGMRRYISKSFESGTTYQILTNLILAQMVRTSSSRNRLAESRVRTLEHSPR